MPSLVNDETDIAVKPDGKSQRHIQSITTGMRLLRVIEEATNPVSLKEISVGAGMPSGQAHLYLVSLRMAGLVVQDSENSRYSLGPFALQLGLSALRQLDVVEMSRDIMKEIQKTTGETVYLAIWGNRGPTIVSRLDGARPLPMTIRVGYTLPVLTSAIGRVFLAFLPRSATEQFVRDELQRANGDLSDTERTIANIESEVKAKGYSESQSLQLFTGFVGLSMPVFNHEQEISAALTIIGPVGQVDVTPGGIMHRALTKGARNLSEKLGYRYSQSAG